jgi:hypothetical protein
MIEHLSHTPALAGSSCELVPINKPASLFPVVGDTIKDTLCYKNELNGGK